MCTRGGVSEVTRVDGWVGAITYRVVMFFFFFSSRRRHTRFDCDWSSDVCSSDLASGVLAQRDRLVLADFENRTADSTLGPSLTEALRVDLAQSGVIRLLDVATVGQALGRMGRPPSTPLDLAVARELAQREGAKGVVRGQIDPLGRGYVVSAELVSAADGAALVSRSEERRVGK